MHCPTCAIAFDHQRDLAHCLHVDYRCACGQLLQWDQPVRALARRAFAIGPPRPCEHATLRQLHALFPRSASKRECMV